MEHLGLLMTSEMCCEIGKSPEDVLTGTDIPTLVPTVDCTTTNKLPV